MDIEEFDKHAYAYRAWPGSDQQGVAERFTELCVYVESLIAAEREACAQVCEEISTQPPHGHHYERAAHAIRMRSNNPK